jgi:SAM-dependent methyltransferase
MPQWRRLILDPFVPTGRDLVGKILDFAEISDKSVFLDLGSGDGRLVLEAARQGVAKAVGVEINPLLVDYSTGLARKLRLLNAVFVNEDIRRISLAFATHITAYLTTNTLRKIEPMLLTARDDAVIVTHNYPIPGWKPVEKLSAWSSSDGKTHVLYKYIPTRSAPRSLVLRRRGMLWGSHPQI